MKFIRLILLLFLGIFCREGYANPQKSISPFELNGRAENLQGIKEGIVYLYWDASALLPDLENWKISVQRYRHGMWQDIRVLPASMQTYQDSVYACSELISYRLSLWQMRGIDTFFITTSTTLELNVQDHTPPSGLEIDSLTVEPNNKVALGWPKSLVVDAVGYVVTREDAGFPIEIDTLVGTSNTFYMDSKSDPLALQKYRIAVLDGCNNRSIYSTSRHVFLTTVKYESCGDSIYISCTSPLEALAHTDSLYLYGKFGKDFPYNKLNACAYRSNINFVYPAVSNPSYKYYKISSKENSSGYTSSALSDSVIIAFPKTPDYFILRKVEVTKEQHPLLSFVIDTQSVFGGIEIYRYQSDSNKAKKISNISYSDLIQNYLWQDVGVDAAKMPYSYYALLKDTCGRVVLKTASHQTICLKLRSKEITTLTLTWNTYAYWQSQNLLDCFEIYAYTSLDPPKKIGEIAALSSRDPNLEYEFTYTYSSLEVIAKTFFYVLAKEKGESPERVRSNELGFMDSENPKFYMPTGFKPGGYTSTYKPIGLFYEGDEYDFYIFQYSGKMIFKSHDPNSGWDGTFKGVRVKPDIYIYKISLKRNGEIFKKTGSVTVVE